MGRRATLYALDTLSGASPFWELVMSTPDALVFLDRQHAGKPGASSWRDRGAAADLDGDGTVEVDEAEAHRTAWLAVALERAFQEGAAELRRDVAVFVLSDGWYRERHARIDRYAAAFPGVPALALALHYNASRNPDASQGLVFHDYRSTKGPELAARVAADLGRAWPGVLSRVRALPARPDDWTRNAFNTISGIGRPVSLCLEPGFLTSPAHAPLFDLDGTRRTARAVAGACLDFLFPGGGGR